MQTLRTYDRNGVLKPLITAAQRQMIRIMQRNYRHSWADETGTKTLEPWLDWQIRSYRDAINTISQEGICIYNHVEDLKRSWAGHIARLGTKIKESHPVKFLVSWRPHRWWKDQQFYNELGWYTIFHPSDVGILRRWENGLSSNWMLTLSGQ